MLFISSSCIKSENIFDIINQLKTFTKNIELSGGTKIEENILENLIKIKKEKNINFLLHNYFPPPKKDFVLNFADTSIKTRDFIKSSVDYIKSLGISYYSVHAGFKKNYDIDNEILINGKSSFDQSNIFENIDWFYEFFNIKLALENLYPNNRNDTCFMSHIDEIVEFLEKDKRIFLLLDLGHLKISAMYYKFDYMEAINILFSRYANRILEIHLSENNGIEDSHNIIEKDSIQYKILEKFKDKIINHNINLVIEVRGYELHKLKKCYCLINKLIGE